MKVILTQEQQGDQGQPKPRTKSATTSPYFDLDASIAVAKVIRERGGTGCEADQLALWLQYASTRSGTYLTRVAAAKQFGLLAGNSSHFTITDRALAIVAPVMPSDAIRAKGEAFLSVELFAKIYADFKGKMLPPPVGLSNLFQNTYGIIPDRVPTAVRVFLNSAQQSGYLQGSGDSQRLVPPAAIPNIADNLPGDKVDPPPVDKPKHGSGSGGGGNDPPGIHTAIIGLLRDLPPPGTAWPTKAKARFMAAFKANIDHIYPEDDEP